MVYLTKDNKFREINFDIVNPNSDKTNLRFELIDTIGVKESNNYFYLYYGNVFLQDVFKLTSTAKPIDDKSFVVSIGEENKHPLNVDISRKWILKGGTTLDTKFKSSQVKVSTSDTKIMSTATLNIMDKNFKIVQSVNMLKDLGIESFTQSIDLSSLAVGDYAVQISATVDGAKENSPKQKIHISWPLYVNWSIDWEGDDVTDKSLQTVESIANENKVPITHYFNPRIYVGGMSSERSKFLTNWVLNRKAKNGDEIGLHLHMWYDMVKTIGITEKREPFWDDAKTGHDVPQTAYSAEEFDQMVSWALMQFNAHGLPVPNVYRAGGWQINIDQLKVLAKYRFLADSSGRDSIKFGKKQYQVPWSLYPTTKPYKPSIYDMNTPGVTNIGLWEFPNNGDNTSSYGPNSTKVIDNFKENYDGSALKEKQMFVILSHMQYFSNDEPVVRRFFAEVSKSLASSDSGPVIYSTIQSVIPEYENVVK